MIAVLTLLALTVLFFPVSSDLIDILLLVNFTFALTLVLLVLNSKDTLKLSTLPTLLLLATFFRLCTNIATTRCILSNGDAGALIRTFGEITINQSLLIGSVIFIVITVVQFVVIAKGGERIAEVSARFSLDALPGKQMAIDADLRAGALDFEQAKFKREELQLESRFYGSLDGAMKIIKGDAVVFIFISLINIIFGIILGIINGGTISEVINKYSILTIGDGLFAQVTSLLCSFAAVMLVTKSSRESKFNFSDEIISQVFQNKKITFSVLITSLLLSCFTGAYYALLLLLFGLVALFIKKRKDNSFNKLINVCQKEQQLSSLQEIIKIIIPQGSSKEDLQNISKDIYSKIFEETGLLLPSLNIVQSSEFKSEYRLIYRGNLIRKIKYDLKPENCNLSGVFADCLLQELLIFVNDSTTKRLLDYYESEYSELINSLIPQIVNTTQITTILKQLIEEQISIRDFPSILQAISENVAKIGVGRQLLEEVRIALNITITNQIIKELDVGDEVVSVINLDPRTDYYLTCCEREGKLPQGMAIKQLVESLSEAFYSKVNIVTSRGARKLISEICQSMSLSNKVYAVEEIKRIAVSVVKTVKFDLDEAEMSV